MNIVEWLRFWASWVSPKLDEAADEIERLRGLVDKGIGR